MDFRLVALRLTLYACALGEYNSRHVKACSPTCMMLTTAVFYISIVSFDREFTPVWANKFTVLFHSVAVLRWSSTPRRFRTP
ncbi:hypothetical protein BD413DRAFT_525877 [Trametes elegans]|nr:hypothetical protein BD413DRAFT_525877 [Trametes elegans]